MDRAIASVTGWIAASCCRVGWTEPCRRNEMEAHVLSIACGTEAALLGFTEGCVEDVVRAEDARVRAERERARLEREALEERSRVQQATALAAWVVEDERRKRAASMPLPHELKASPNHTLRCMLCPATSTRLFCPQGLAHHQRDKHGVS
jgi:hypothetical protein